MNSEKLVTKVAEAAVRGERGDGGWLRVDVPGATDKEICLAIMEAEERGLVEACEVTNTDSEYREWRLTGPTGATQQFLRETRPSKRLWVIALAIAGAAVGFAKWVIPILISLSSR